LDLRVFSPRWGKGEFANLGRDSCGFSVKGNVLGTDVWINYKDLRRIWNLRPSGVNLKTGTVYQSTRVRGRGGPPRGRFAKVVSDVTNDKKRPFQLEWEWIRSEHPTVG